MHHRPEFRRVDNRKGMEPFSKADMPIVVIGEAGSSSIALLSKG
jgi:hypothetical protein